MKDLQDSNAVIEEGIVEEVVDTVILGDTEALWTITVGKLAENAETGKIHWKSMKKITLSYLILFKN